MRPRALENRHRRPASRVDKEHNVTVVDLPQRERLPRVPFQVEIFSGNKLAAARWPSVTDTRDFRMYVFQLREILDV